MNRQYATQTHNLNQASQEAISHFFDGDKFIWSTELVAAQQTRAAEILKTQTGTLNGLIEKMDTEYTILYVLLYGLDALGKVTLELGGGAGYIYRVLD